MPDPKIIEKLKLDIEQIRKSNDRTGRLAEQPFRWEGCEINPNGWRLMADLADDIEKLLEQIK